MLVIYRLLSVLLDLISQVEQSANLLTLPPGVLNPASEARVAFERLIAKLDNIESDFDRLAQRAGGSFLWTSEPSHD
jgi:hypothetical protein